ncbi:hypothetical protein ABEB36_014702 [Hypothenemus hampei]|uniref:Uncharacterized protein n=1 Tax=Hypothenemus hampei TaxID=57062 RepID=A0ABD1E2W0_HYPHA
MDLACCHYCGRIPARGEGVVLDTPGIHLRVLELQFQIVCRGYKVLSRLGVGSFRDLLELSPIIVVREERVYVARFHEETDEESDDSDYFVN